MPASHSQYPSFDGALDFFANEYEIIHVLQPGWIAREMCLASQNKNIDKTSSAQVSEVAFINL
jgi:hypothetical protein